MKLKYCTHRHGHEPSFKSGKTFLLIMFYFFYINTDNGKQGGTTKITEYSSYLMYYT